MANPNPPDNLIPIRTTERAKELGRLGGLAKKGSKSLSAIIRELEAEDFDWSLVPVKQKEAMQKIGSPWRAITFTAVAKAASGDTRAMEWLRRAGYGDKMELSGGVDVKVVSSVPEEE